MILIKFDTIRDDGGREKNGKSVCATVDSFKLGHIFNFAVLLIHPTQFTESVHPFNYHLNKAA